MKKEQLINEIEQLINAEIAMVNLESEMNQEGKVEAFMRKTAIRLIKSYHGYITGESGISNILADIRNFMLVFQCRLRIDTIEVPMPNKFGIYRDEYSGKYYAAYDVPDYIKYDSLVKDAFITESTQEQPISSKYLLDTNGYIKKLTGFDYFKSIEQKLCVYGALNTQPGFTTLVSMPTGGGKSLVTQALSYENKGLSIVIVPTVSLAIDQERVAKKNIRCASDGEIFCYYSGVNNFADIIKAIQRQTVKLLFISPEALIKNEKFKELISEANKSRYLKNIIIDEAHIVVSWGDFFRVDYQCLGPWRKELLRCNPQIRTFLLSATFSDETVDTLKRIFSEESNWIEVRCDSLRKEPRYAYIEADGFTDKKNKVADMINKLPRPMIVYVNSPYEAKKWMDIIGHHGYSNLHMFTGETKSDERRILIDEWVEDDFDLMIATSAFGVGVDKPDVRSVIHLYAPENPDTYYQELGRGGRDGLPCLSVMCLDHEDIQNGSKHVTKVLTKDTFWGRWWSMYSNPQNMWQSGSIAILASTKPNYNKTDYFEEGNDTDERWNINVLLLLSRYQQIQITGLDLDNENRYIFTVKVMNDLILHECDEAKQLFESIRNRETKRAQGAFGLLKTAIVKRDVLCWSEMFAETYPLVSEYCAGCNCHEDIVFDEVNRFPLLTPINAPKKVLSDAMKEFFGETRSALIITKKNISSLVTEYKPDVVICEEFPTEDTLIVPGINYMNFSEYRELQSRDNGVYTTGLIMIVYSKSDEKNRKNFQSIYRYLEKDRYVLHVSQSDFVVSSASGKCISDFISGTVVKE